MKLKNISKVNGELSNLKLIKENKIITSNSIFEVDDERAKELLNTKNNDGLIVERVKEDKKEKKTEK